jgi:hypothetical protein
VRVIVSIIPPVFHAFSSIMELVLTEDIATIAM